MRRQQAETIGSICQAILDNTWLGPAMERIDIFKAWDDAVGGAAAAATARKFFKDGILHITLTSSALRSHLYFLRDSIRRQINTSVSGSPDGPVKNIILK